jgi:two-component system, response regulator PdtaR
MLPKPMADPVSAQILVIEGDALIRMMVAEELRDAGFHVTEAENADDTRSYLATAGPVGLIFSDVRMPGSC